MNLFRNISIRNKLLAIILSITIPIVIGQAIYNIHQEIEYNKKQIHNNTNSTAELTGNYCIPDIIFHDKSQALKSISSLAQIHSVMQCTLFDKEGDLFAKYTRGEFKEPLIINSSLEKINLFSDEYYAIIKDIFFKSEKVGSIAMIISTQESSDSLLKQIKGVFYLTMILILISIILSFQLQKIISKPLLQLAMLSEKVRVTHDFSLREKKISNDEIGLLVSGFNSLLSNIQETTVSKDYVDNIIESMEPLFVINQRGIITKTNASASHLSGLKTEEILNSDINNLMDSSLNWDSVGHSFDTNLINKSGTKIPISISITRVDKNSWACLAHDLSERIKHEKEIIKSLAEKEVLLKEIHHRVKNNLQIISSLLNFQSNSIPDESVKAMFLESQDRIRTMALIHTKLYQSKNLGEIKVYEYLDSLVSSLKGSYSIETDIELEIETQISVFEIETVIPLGLIINELVTNSLKYAFKGKNNGKIYIYIKLKNKNTCVIEIGDNGSGLPKNFILNYSETLGLQLVKIFSEQLQGKIIHDTSVKGTKFILTFELPKKNAP